MRRRAFVYALIALAVGCSRAERPGVPAAGPGNSQPVYLDVRTPAEYASEHIRGALNIPHDQIEQQLATLEPYRNRRIIIYCRSGRRAALAFAVLQAKSFPQVENGGTLDRLVAEGVPVVRAQ